MHNHFLIAIAITTLIVVLGFSHAAEGAFTSAAFVIGASTWLTLRALDGDQK